MIDFRNRGKKQMTQRALSLTQNNNLPKRCPSKGSFRFNNLDTKKQEKLTMSKQHLEANTRQAITSQNQPGRNTSLQNSRCSDKSLIRGEKSAKWNSSVVNCIDEQFSLIKVLMKGLGARSVLC